MTRSFPAALLLTLLALLSACAHVTNENQALCQDKSVPCGYDPTGGYRFLPGKNAERDTLVVLTFSGGGIRASALAYGTLKALQELPGRTGPGSRLIDDVDIISAVSGGSVTAGWYALEGEEGLGEKSRLQDFFHTGGMAALAFRGLNPVALLGYAATPYQRSDVLRGYFADHLFSENGKAVTYDAVIQRYKRDPNQPFVILNATDLGHETRFPFTQGQFDLLCSDLAPYRLADAVASSANFPVVFSPIGLTNYSADCAAHNADAWKALGPPRWINEYACYDGAVSTDQRLPSGLYPIADTTAFGGTLPRSNGLLQVRAARTARDYVDPLPDDRVVHLVDGGVVDNLGVLTTLALEDHGGRLPGIFQRLTVYDSRGQRPCPDLPAPASIPERSERYKHIKEVLYIVVNARTRDAPGIDDTVYPPDVVSTVIRIIGTPLDATILDNQNYLTAELQAILRQPPQTSIPPTGQNACNSDRMPDPKKPPVCARIVSIDFELITNKRCRDNYWKIGTTWTLDDKIVQALIALPKVMLRHNLEDAQGELHLFYSDLARLDGRVDPAVYGAAKNFPADFVDICKAVEPSR